MNKRWRKVLKCGGRASLVPSQGLSLHPGEQHTLTDREPNWIYFLDERQVLQRHRPLPFQFLQSIRMFIYHVARSFSKDHNDDHEDSQHTPISTEPLKKALDAIQSISLSQILNFMLYSSMTLVVMLIVFYTWEPSRIGFAVIGTVALSGFILSLFERCVGRHFPSTRKGFHKFNMFCLKHSLLIFLVFAALCAWLIDLIEIRISNHVVPSESFVLVAMLDPLTDWLGSIFPDVASGLLSLLVAGATLQYMIVPAVQLGLSDSTFAGIRSINCFKSLSGPKLLPSTFVNDFKDFYDSGNDTILNETITHLSSDFTAGSYRGTPEHDKLCRWVVQSEHSLSKRIGLGMTYFWVRFDLDRPEKIFEDWTYFPRVVVYQSTLDALEWFEDVIINSDLDSGQGHVQKDELLEAYDNFRSSLLHLQPHIEAHTPLNERSGEYTKSRREFFSSWEAFAGMKV
jgi:hypothetical protein